MNFFKLFSNSNLFSLNQIISGNWTKINNNNKQNIILYFVVIGLGKYEALLNDYPLQLNITNNNSLIFSYKTFLTNLTFLPFSKQIYLSQNYINNSYYIDILLLSQNFIEIIIINNNQIEKWIFQKNFNNLFKLKDFIKIIIYLTFLIYFGLKLIKKKNL